MKALGLKAIFQIWWCFSSGGCDIKSKTEMKCVCCVRVDSFHQLQMTFFSSPSLSTFFPQQLLELTLSLLSRSLLPWARLPTLHPGLAALACVVKGLGGRISHSAAGFYPSPNELWQRTSISLGPCSCIGPLERCCSSPSTTGPGYSWTWSWAAGMLQLALPAFFSSACFQPTVKTYSVVLMSHLTYL